MRQALRTDALVRSTKGLELRVGLPWIRSLPLSALTDLAVSVNGGTIASQDVQLRIGNENHPIGALPLRTGTWWFAQDRIVLEMPAVDSDEVDIAVDLRLSIPYITNDEGQPLTVPVKVQQTLQIGTPAAQPSAARDVEPSTNGTPN
jgi:hypothetical protein